MVRRERVPYSSAPDVSRLTSSLSLRGAARNSRPWIHYVPSALNISDVPSRPIPSDAADEDSLKCLGFPLCRIEFIFRLVLVGENFKALCPFLFLFYYCPCFVTTLALMQTPLRRGSWMSGPQGAATGLVFGILSPSHRSAEGVFARG